MAAAKGNNYTLKRKVSPQYTVKQLEALANDLLHYAETSKSIHLAPWTRGKGFSLSWLNFLSKDHEIMRQAHSQAKELLAAKVLNSSFYGQGNATVGMAYLPVYDQDFRALLEYKASLAKQSETDMTKTADQFVKAIREAKLLDLLKQED